MNLMLFRGLASRLLLSKRKVKEEPPAVISVTEPILITSAEDGNTYSLDSVTARITLPLSSTLTTGWTIRVQTTVIGRYIVVRPAEVGLDLVTVSGEPSDGISMDSLDAKATIEFTGFFFEANVLAGTVNGYLD